MVIGTVGPGDEKFVDVNGTEYWFDFPARGGALGFSSSSPFPPKSTTGERTYQDYDVFSAVAFTDMSGGMGQDRAEDATKYYDAQNVDARGGRIVLGPLVTATAIKGLDDFSHTALQRWAYYDAGALFPKDVDSTTPRTACHFTTLSDQTSLDRVWLPIKASIAAGTITVKLYTDSSGLPDAVVATTTIDREALRVGGSWVPAVFATAVSVSAETKYWVSVEHAGATGSVSWLGDYVVAALDKNTVEWVTGWAEPAINWHMVVWLDDPTVRPDSSLHYILGSGKDGIIRLWGYAGKYLYYIAANGTPTVVEDGAGSAYRAAADIVDAEWFQGSGDTHPFLYLALGDDTDMVKFDGEIGAEDWTAVTGYQARSLAVHDNLLWRVDERNQVDGTLVGDWSETPVAGKVGNKTYPVRNMLSWNGDLYLGKDDGLYKLTYVAGYPAGADAPVLSQQLDFLAQSGVRNFNAMTVHQGDLYFNIAQGIVKYTSGGVLTSVSPDTGLNLSSSQRSEYLSLFSSMNVLWAVAEGGFKGLSSLLTYIDGNWHPLVTAVREADMMRSVYLEPSLYGALPRVYFGLGLQVAYVQMPTTTQKRWQWSNAAYAASGRLELSWVDGNIRTIEKDWVSVALDVRDVAADGNYVQVWWRPDEDTAWVKVGANITSTGISTLNFPASSHGSKAQIRVYLYRGATTTSTPQVEAVVVKYLERPADLRGFTRTYELSSRGTWRSGAIRQESLAEQVAQLETLRESKEPLTWYPWWGGSYSVHITKYGGSDVPEERGDLLDQGTITAIVELQALV